MWFPCNGVFVGDTNHEESEPDRQFLGETRKARNEQFDELILDASRRTQMLLSAISLT
jgi:hypothetical protein